MMIIFLLENALLFSQQRLHQCFSKCFLLTLIFIINFHIIINFLMLIERFILINQYNFNQMSLYLPIPQYA